MLRSALLPAGDPVEALAPRDNLRACPPGLLSAGESMVGSLVVGVEDMTEEVREAVEAVITAADVASSPFCLESLDAREKTPC